MNLEGALGLVATMIVIVGNAPQAIKVWRTRQTRDVSLGGYLLISLACIAWGAYAILRGDAFLLMANMIILCLAGSVVIAKLKYK